MYTNVKSFGGDFIKKLDSEFSSAKNAVIASGYASLDIIKKYDPNFIDIAEKGGISKLLLGMAFYEGLGQKKLDALTSLNDRLSEFGNSSGVYVTNGRRYHGKVYHFFDEKSSSIFVGSSNFSSSGTQGNIECTMPVIENSQQTKIKDFLNALYSPSFSIRIDRAEITVPGKKKVVLNKVDNYWRSLARYNPKGVNVERLSKFEFPLGRVVSKEKSSLNVYFGKGRENKKTGKIIPRPWYEIELIANNDINSLSDYPKGDFEAYTDDGLIIPMRTQGDYFKNIRSKKSLQIFGIWLKGKLERAEVLKRYEPVTQDTLLEYGNDKLTFYKIEEGKYYLSF